MIKKSHHHSSVRLKLLSVIIIMHNRSQQYCIKFNFLNLQYYFGLTKLVS